MNPPPPPSGPSPPGVLLIGRQFGLMVSFINDLSIRRISESWKMDLVNCWWSPPWQHWIDQVCAFVWARGACVCVCVCLCVCLCVFVCAPPGLIQAVGSLNFTESLRCSVSPHHRKAPSTGGTCTCFCSDLYLTSLPYTQAASLTALFVTSTACVCVLTMHHRKAPIPP